MQRDVYRSTCNKRLISEEDVMESSITPLLLCAGGSGGAARARAVCVHGALKLCARVLRLKERRGEKARAIEILQETLSGLQRLLSSEDMEVQERAHDAAALLALVLAATEGDRPVVDIPARSVSIPLQETWRCTTPPRC
ncbi:unnamed protein product [Plutella xylostella]|uniref:(diamondback moth) hypothetical protein n=1 Tax=Plutella xylostella TaxID=51655 RepID=A0A8S4E0T9_PLUXY|nr:unnamed protein product [Plutella xylostella]